MREKILELIRELDPDIQELVAMVIQLEREHLDQKKPHVKEAIRDQIDKYAKESLKSEGKIG